MKTGPFGKEITKLFELRERAYFNASRQPKNIFDLMEGVDAFDSVTACGAIQSLVDDGLLQESRQDGPHFQHKFFVAALPPGDASKEYLMAAVLAGSGHGPKFKAEALGLLLERARKGLA